MANPANSSLYSHRQQLRIKNTTTGSEIVVDRLQSIDPSFNLRTDPYYEIGRKGKIGSTQHPPEYRIAGEQNMTDSLELEYCIAGKSVAPAGAQTYNAGDFVTYADKITAYILQRNNDNTVLNELEITGCSVAEWNYRFTVGGALMNGFTLVGRDGQLYQAASVVHPAWGTLDDISLGGIHGKDARIWFTSGSVAADRAFRVQNFNIRVAYPTVNVREIGNRALVGTNADAPDISIDFDILLADDQPTEKFFQLSGGAYQYDTPTTAFNAYVRVFDPRDTEALTVLRMFKLENVLPVSHTPVRSQVRGLATARYSLTVSKETTTDSGGLIVSNKNTL